MKREPKVSFAHIRLQSARLGRPLDHISDEAMARAFVRLCDEVKRFGYSVEDLAAGFDKMGKDWAALRETEGKP